MAQVKERRDVKPGDLVVVSGHRVGESERLGEILEVLDPGPRQHYRVRWEDGRETIFYPSSDAVVRPGKKPKR
jgi:hypothetical protein